MALKLQNKSWFPAILLIGCTAVFVTWLRFGANHGPEVLLSGLGAVAGFTYFLYRQHLDETKLFKELFVEFNERYGKMNDGLNRILSGPADADLSEQERDLLFGYFNLCSEEYLFYRAGYIDERVWQSWRKGMDLFLNHPRVAALWQRERQNDSYYGFSSA
jgi:hypothetical protein